jgi:hypothetical protein
MLYILNIVLYNTISKRIEAYVNMNIKINICKYTM